MTERRAHTFHDSRDVHSFHSDCGGPVKHGGYHHYRRSTWGGYIYLHSSYSAQAARPLELRIWLAARIEDPSCGSMPTLFSVALRIVELTGHGRLVLPKPPPVVVGDHNTI